MPPHRRAPQYRVVGKNSIVLTIILVLVLANTSASLALAYFGKHLIPQNLPNSHACAAMSSSGIRYGVPDWICWYASRGVWITVILFGVGAIILFVYRRNLERAR
jgi:hypothetical protein